MARLEEIDLERVDGVDEPATRQRFLLLKAEEPEELRQNVEGLLRQVEAALQELAKIEDLPLTESAAQALNGVAKALDLGVTFKARHKDEEYGHPEYGYPPPRRQRKEAEAPMPAADVLAKAIADAVREALAPAVEVWKAAAAPPAPAPPSRQADGQDPVAKSQPKRLGDGLFANVIFGE